MTDGMQEACGTIAAWKSVAKPSPRGVALVVDANSTVSYAIPVAVLASAGFPAAAHGTIVDPTTTMLTNAARLVQRANGAIDLTTRMRR
jgi:hypothetical protein